MEEKQVDLCPTGRGRPAGTQALLRALGSHAGLQGEDRLDQTCHGKHAPVGVGDGTSQIDRGNR